MFKLFPVILKENKVACFNCDIPCSDQYDLTENCQNNGQYRAYCQMCKMFTWFDWISE